MDKQLFPTKARWHWTQYMSNKPVKFVIKFWLASDPTPTCAKMKLAQLIRDWLTMWYLG
ncbi:UNVERIFIED_CONTAM: hypothetical protein FKN15_070797 [Acipenser sinensis]